jgi:hypothetical protein
MLVVFVVLGMLVALAWVSAALDWVPAALDWVPAVWKMGRVQGHWLGHTLLPGN